MNNKIVLATQFQVAITEIYKNSLFIPDNFYETILSKFESLKIFPKMYPKSEKSHYRKIPIKNFIILYTVHNSEIKIINIISTKSSFYNELY